MLYETIRGLVCELFHDYVVIETGGGIGFKIFIPVNLYTKGLSVGEEAMLYISHIVRQDSERLYGFSMRETRNFFDKLCTISGVGARTALALIGHMENRELKAAIEMGDAALLSRIPGIGKKTAERIIVELGDTVHKWQITQEVDIEKGKSNMAFDALHALLNLGYKRPQAQKAVSRALEEEDFVHLSQVITRALKLV